MHWTGTRTLSGLLAAALLFASAARAGETTVLECTAAAYLWPKGGHLDTGHLEEGDVRYRLDATASLLVIDSHLGTVDFTGQLMQHGDDTIFLSDVDHIPDMGLATVTFVHNTASGLFTAVTRYLTQPEIQALGADAAWRDPFTVPLDHLFTEWGLCIGPAA